MNDRHPGARRNDALPDTAASSGPAANSDEPYSTNQSEALSPNQCEDVHCVPTNPGGSGSGSSSGSGSPANQRGAEGDPANQNRGETSFSTNQKRGRTSGMGEMPTRTFNGSLDEKKERQRFMASFLDEIKNFEKGKFPGDKSNSTSPIGAANSNSTNLRAEDSESARASSSTEQRSTAVNTFSSLPQLNFHTNDDDFGHLFEIPQAPHPSPVPSRPQSNPSALSFPFTTQPMRPTPHSQQQGSSPSFFLGSPGSAGNTGSGRTLSNGENGVQIIPEFTEKDLHSILATVPDSILDDLAPKNFESHLLAPDPQGAVIEDGRVDAVDELNLVTSPTKAREVMDTIMHLANKERQEEEESPMRPQHFLSDPGEPANSNQSLSLPHYHLPPSETKPPVRVEPQEEQITLFGFPLTRVLSPELNPETKYFAISEIFQKFFNSKHWDEFKTNILEKNGIRPIVASSLEVISEGDVSSLLMHNQARKDGFVPSFAVDSRTGTVQPTVIKREERRPGELTSGIKTRHGDQSDIAYINIQGGTVPCVQIEGAQWVRLADIQGKLLEGGKDADGNREVTTKLIQKLKSLCGRMNVMVEKIPQNVKFRLTACANSCHSKSLHVIEAKDLGRVVAHYQRMEIRRLEREKRKLVEEQAERRREAREYKRLRIAIPDGLELEDSEEEGSVAGKSEESWRPEDGESDDESLGSLSRSNTPSSYGDNYSPRFPPASALHSPASSGALGSSRPRTPNSVHGVTPSFAVHSGLLTTADTPLIEKALAKSNNAAWRNSALLKGRMAAGGGSVAPGVSHSVFRNDGASQWERLGKEISPMPSPSVLPPVLMPRSPPSGPLTLAKEQLRRLDGRSQVQAEACKPCSVKLEHPPEIKVVLVNTTGTRGFSGSYLDHFFVSPNAPCIYCDMCDELMSVKRFTKHNHDGPISNNRLLLQVRGPPTTTDYASWESLTRKLRRWGFGDLSWEVPEGLHEYYEPRQAGLVSKPSKTQLKAGARLCNTINKIKKSLAPPDFPAEAKQRDSGDGDQERLELAQKTEALAREVKGMVFRPLEPVNPAQKQYRGDSFDKVYSRMALDDNWRRIEPADFPVGFRDAGREALIMELYGGGRN